MNATLNWHFEYPWALLSPLIMIAIAWWRTRVNLALPLPSTQLTSDCLLSWRQVSRRPILNCLSIATLVCLGLAAARPVEMLTVKTEQSRRNIILCLDVSKSMEYSDFSLKGNRAARLTAIKSVIAEFIPLRSEDRIGMVIFGSSAFLQVPLTLDHELVLTFLQSLNPGIAGGGTAIGDGLGLSVKRIKDIPGLAKAIILVTDGVNNSGNLNPLQAAKLAKSLKIKVHTIGVGNPLNREFDETTLREIANSTGGVYFNAQDTSRLEQIYQEIDQLETSTQKEQQNNLRIEHFWKFAVGAAVFYFLYSLMARTYYLSIP